METPKFEVVENWAKIPEYLTLPEIPDVAVDSQDRLFVFSRYPQLVSIFDPDGTYVKSWGHGEIAKAHGIYIDGEDNVFLADVGNHTVRKFTADGALLLTLGTPFRPSDTGIEVGWQTVQKSAEPFNCPTHTTVAPSGEIFVTDGYGNARVHRFTAEGKLIMSWGEQGHDEGFLNLPHGIVVDERDRVYVADRENSRIQVFTLEGSLLEVWGFPNRPNNIRRGPDGLLYISEIGFTHNIVAPPQWIYTSEPPPGHTPYARVSVCTTDGEVLAHIGEEDVPKQGNIIIPHGVCLDSKGDMYVGETPIDALTYHHYAPHKLNTIQKFRRVQ